MSRNRYLTRYLSRDLPCSLRARLAALRSDPDRGNLLMSLAVVIIFATIAVGLFSATVAASTLGRATTLRAANLDTANSLRSQVLGNLNLNTTTVTSNPVSGAIILATPPSATGCTGPGNALASFNLGPQGCATIGYTLATPATPTAMATHDQTISITLDVWQHPGATTTKLAQVTQTFQAYGTCVTGYLPGTGTGTGVPAVYIPCRVTTPAAAQHLIWYAKDTAG